MKNFSYPTRKLCFAVLFSAAFLPAFSQQIHKSIKISTGDKIGFLEYKPANYNQHPDTKYPLIIFLHGIGERGTGVGKDLDRVACCGLPRIIKYGNKMEFTWNGKKQTFLVLSPQCPKKYGMWPQQVVDDMIEYAKKNLQIDENRIYLTGLSMGAGGSYKYMSNSQAAVNKLAASATICPPCIFNNGAYIAKANLPLWSFHAKDDRVVNWTCTKAAIDKINASKPAVKPLVNYWPTGGHRVWDRVYTDTNYVYQGAVNIYEWFLGQWKGAPINKLPVANAGRQISITNGTGIATLDASGSTDADGNIVRYVWKKISGPSEGKITTVMGSSPSTTVERLKKAGSYKFELTVVDDRASFSVDTVTVVVSSGAASANRNPVAQAMDSIIVSSPQTEVTLNGNSSKDVDGKITSYKWTRSSGPAATIVTPNKAVTRITNLQPGVYNFVLEVTDNNGASSRATVIVTVLSTAGAKNAHPVAKAGHDTTVTLPLKSFGLSAVGSIDKDGSIKSYKWVKVSGPVAVIVSPLKSTTKITGFGQGVYVFAVIVTDDKGASSADTISVAVNPAAQAKNNKPVANAGSDASIALPVNKILLNGEASSDSDGLITSYTWTKISGPSQFHIAAAGKVSTSVTNLVEGTYIFRLYVKDNRKSSDDDTVQVTVARAPLSTNKPPRAMAGNTQSITFPENSVTLNGSASYDQDGTITRYKWSFISGPQQFEITNPDAPVTIVKGLVIGVYAFQLQVFDNKEWSWSDTVSVIVKEVPARLPSPNNNPLANAGKDQTISLPNDEAILDGSASQDTDGKLTGYQWTQISGPDQYKIVDGALEKDTVRFLAEGNYSFLLVVRDNDGAIAVDTVEITVLAASNVSPVANAGSDIDVKLPLREVLLSGKESNDPDGELLYYSWTKVSGPAGLTIMNSTTKSPKLIGLTEGKYVFNLGVSDISGAQASDEIIVTVQKGGSNSKTMALAGKDKTIYFPETTIRLNGNDSYDNDGYISAYHWNLIKGPSLPQIIQPDSGITDVTNLVSGEYIFQLAITNTMGNVAYDRIRVTVSGNPKTRDLLSVYPNPARSELNLQIKSDTTGRTNIYIYNSNGIAVKSIQAEKASVTYVQTVSVTELQKGVYYLEVNVGNKKRMISTFIKN